RLWNGGTRLQSGSAPGRRRGGVGAGPGRHGARGTFGVQVRREAQPPGRVLDFSEASFDSLLDSMRASTPWIVLDVPHLWSAWARRILVSADEVIVVASPDLANLRNTKNLIDNVKGARLNDAPSRLILNGVGMLKRPEIASAEFAKAVETDPTAIIPHDAKLFGAAANNGQMIAEIEPNGKTAQIFV